jgi:hypothetical protein
MSIGAFLLTACSGARFGLQVDSGRFEPGFISGLTDAVNAAADATGMPWLKAVGGVLALLGGGYGVTKGVVKAYDSKPYVGSKGQTLTEAELVDKIKPQA